MGKKKLSLYLQEALETTGGGESILPTPADGLEELDIQAVANPTYVKALKDKKILNKKIKDIMDAKVKAYQDVLDNTEESRMKGNKPFEADKPARKLTLKESLFESWDGENITDGSDGWNSSIKESREYDKIDKLLYELQNGRIGAYTGAETKEELIDYCKEAFDDFIDYLEDFEEVEMEDGEDLDESKKSLTEDVSEFIQSDEDVEGADFEDEKEALKEEEDIEIAPVVKIDLEKFKPWGNAVKNYNKIKEAGKLEDLEKMILVAWPDGIEDQTLNELLAEDTDFLAVNLDMTFDN